MRTECSLATWKASEDPGQEEERDSSLCGALNSSCQVLVYLQLSLLHVLLWGVAQKTRE